MTIKQIKNLLDVITNKYQNGYLSGQEFNDLFRAAEIGYQNLLLGNLHQMRSGRPLPMIGLDMNKAVVEKLSPFRTAINATVTASGEISKSSNIVAIETMNKADGTRIKFVFPNMVSYYLNSAVWDLAANPIYTEYDTYFRFYPDTLGAIVITGIKTPPHSKWAFTLVGDSEVYDNVNSVDPIWKDADCLEILGRVCKLAGVSLKDGELMQFGQGVTIQGE
jgi:hypothetical protein